MNNKVVLGYCSGEQIDSMFLRSLVRMLLQDAQRESRLLPPSGGIIHVRSGPRVATARNTIVRNFLNNWPDTEWLLMLDTDMVFDSDLVERMLDSAVSHKTDILGALCFGGGYSKTIFPTMYHIVGDEIGPTSEIPLGQVAQVDATGAACLLVRRNVYETMAKRFEPPHQWFADSIWNGREIGEDVTFCLRAKLCDFNIFVDTNIQVGHSRSKVIGIDDWTEASTEEVP